MQPHPRRISACWHKIFAGEVPFHDIRPTTVAVDILSENRPGRPVHLSLTDDLWNLTEQCWDHDPQRRPDISGIISYLRTKFDIQYGDDGIPDDTTFGSVRQAGELAPIFLEEVIINEVGSVPLRFPPAAQDPWARASLRSTNKHPMGDPRGRNCVFHARCQFGGWFMGRGRGS